MNRYKILAEVEVIVLARLFGNGPWLIDPETGVALQRRLEQMGLEERVPGTTDMWRNTPLGSELHLDLLMVFMGLWDEWEIPMILEDHGLIDDLEAEHMLDLLGARGGNPGGSPYRARERLNADTIREMHLGFNRGGRKAIDKVMKYLPDCGPVVFAGPPAPTA